MLSTRYQCIYVRVSKAASSSIQQAFRQPNSIMDYLKHILFERGEFDMKHHDLAHYSKTYPDYFQEYYKFSFVRNPWGRIFSQYRYHRYNLKSPEAQCSFEDWVKKCLEAYNSPEEYLFGRNRHIFIRHITNQLDWFIVEGKLTMDFIGRYESLNEDFDKICKSRSWNLRLPRINTTKAEDEDYIEHYTPELVDIVGQLHSKDLEEFGYRFES